MNCCCSPACCLAFSDHVGFETAPEEQWQHLSHVCIGCIGKSPGGEAVLRDCHLSADTCGCSAWGTLPWGGMLFHQSVAGWGRTLFFMTYLEDFITLVRMLQTPTAQQVSFDFPLAVMLQVKAAVSCLCRSCVWSSWQSWYCSACCCIQCIWAKRKLKGCTVSLTWVPFIASYLPTFNYHRARHSWICFPVFSSSVNSDDLIMQCLTFCSRYVTANISLTYL